MAYFRRTSQGERLGITTFAPARMPRCRPSGSRVARAVVAGIRARGASSRRTEISSSVVRTLPAGSRPKGVSCCGTKGPMPIMWGRKRAMNATSAARRAAVWPGAPIIMPVPVW